MSASKVFDNTVNHDDKAKSKVRNIYDHLLLWCGIGVLSYVGAYIRVGVYYYRMRGAETNYAIMYA